MVNIDFTQATANRATAIAHQLSCMQTNLSRDEAILTDLSRDLVSALGVLKKAEAAQSKLGANGNRADSRITQLRDEIGSLTRREDVAGRICKAATILIEAFLDEGSPSNRDLLAAYRDFEEAERELARL